MEGRQGWALGYSTGVPCGLSSIFNFLLPWSQFELPKYVRWRYIISFACFVIPLYLKQMKNMALKQIDSYWNEKDLYPSECWCRNKWKKNMLVGSWSSLNWYFFFLRVDEAFSLSFLFSPLGICVARGLSGRLVILSILICKDLSHGQILTQRSGQTSEQARGVQPRGQEKEGGSSGWLHYIKKPVRPYGYPTPDGMRTN